MTTSNAVPYGARPVSIDLTRHQALRVLQPVVDEDRVELRHAPARGRDCLERLGVRHWPTGSRIVVCALTGGVGRTTVASAMADLLAGLPYASIWPPVLLVETNPRRRFGSESPSPGQQTECCATPTMHRRLAIVRPSGAHQLLIRPGEAPPTRSETRAVLEACGSRHRVTVLDAPPAVPSDLPWVRDTAQAAVVLVVEPGHRHLDDAADALVWMHDSSALPRERVVVVVNLGRQQGTSQVKAAAISLALRCRALHFVGRLADGRHAREQLARVMLDVAAAFPTATPATRKDAS